MIDAVWTEKAFYDRAECLYYERLSKKRKQAKSESRTEAHNISINQNVNAFVGTTGSLSKEVAKARQQIKESLQSVDSNLGCVKESNRSNVELRIEALEKENRALRKEFEELRSLLSQLNVKAA